jgi:hypothetical protein
MFGSCTNDPEVTVLGLPSSRFPAELAKSVTRPKVFSDLLL